MEPMWQANESFLDHLKVRLGSLKAQPTMPMSQPEKDAFMRMIMRPVTDLRCDGCGTSDQQATLVVVKGHAFCETCILTAHHDAMQTPWCPRCDGRFKK